VTERESESSESTEPLEEVPRIGLLKELGESELERLVRG